MINNSIISFMVILLILFMNVMVVAVAINEEEYPTTTTTFFHKPHKITTTTLFPPTTTTTTLPIPKDCTDSDGGDDPYTPGSVDRQYGLYNHRDRCNLQGNTLTEYYCTPSGYMASKTYSCLCIMSVFGGYCMSS